MFCSVCTDILNNYYLHESRASEVTGNLKCALGMNDLLLLSVHKMELTKGGNDTFTQLSTPVLQTYTSRQAQYFGLITLSCLQVWLARIHRGIYNFIHTVYRK